MARRVPAGVVGVISPFNFPLILSTRSVAPALAVGNAVVLKPDPRTAVAGAIVLARLFEEAGLPEGVLHVLPGGADAGAAVVEDPRVRIVSFTGSTAAGRKVGEAAARLLKRVHLELGGNSALVVLDDADLEPTVSAAAFGSFIHQGQVCMTTGRHIVHADVADEYVERLAEKASHLPVGNPATDQVALGPVIDAGQRDRIHGLVTASVDSGARVAAGGDVRRALLPADGADRGGGHAGVAEEIFGPVAPVASFTTEEEAVALAADTGYGLALGIITRDVMKGVALADRIPSGIVHINDQTVGDEAVAPFGGVGDSGTGSRLGGLGNLEAFTETQWLTIAGEVPPVSVLSHRFAPTTSGACCGPGVLLDARAVHAEGASTTPSCARSRTTRSSRRIRMQEEVGLQSATDGEFRRASGTWTSSTRWTGSAGPATTSSCTSATPRAGSTSRRRR